MLSTASASRRRKHGSSAVPGAGEDPPAPFFLPGVLLLLLSAVALRLYCWRDTNLTLEDALITFRYAGNLASGKGFVYNVGERVLGTTTPLWTLILAAVQGAVQAGPGPASKLLGVLFDAATIMLVAVLVRSTAGPVAALAAAALLAWSPELIPLSVSGMETPLLLFCMALALLGYTRKNVLFPLGLALTLLTRIDGALFVLSFVPVLLLADRPFLVRSMSWVALLVLPWCLFSFVYFGSLLPQSFLAKMSVYRFDIGTSALPFAGAFTPFLEREPLKIVLKSVLVLLLAAGIAAVWTRHRRLAPAAVFLLLYAAAFMTSRAIIFRWYLAPCFFASSILAGVAAGALADRSARSLPKVPSWVFSAALLALVACVNLTLLPGRLRFYRELQAFEWNFRREIGLWLRRDAPAGSTVLLEPIGYIGYFAGPGISVRDEIGIVTPRIPPLRNPGDGWYVRALSELRPDYVVQYREAFEQNRDEGRNEPLFAGSGQREWFLSNYRLIRSFTAPDSQPMIAGKEKAYLVFRRSPPAPAGRP